MSIQVKSSRLDTGSNVTLLKDEAAKYVTSMLESCMNTFEISSYNANVVLKTEGQDHDPVQKCEINLTFGNNKINQSTHSRSIKRAIDKAENEIKRQVRDIKGKKSSKIHAKRVAEQIPASSNLEDILQ